MQIKSSLLLALVGCARILGVPDVTQRDAAFYDTMTDAPSLCPIGAPPSFDHGELVQFLDQACMEISISDDDRVIANCSGISEGVAGSTLAIAPGLQPGGNVRYTSARIAPEGNLATVVRTTAVAVGPDIHEAIIARRDSNGWTPIETLAPLDASHVSQPTRGPNAHVLVTVDVTAEIHELVDSGVGWEDRNTFKLPQYDNSSIQLSPDGLHLWWVQSGLKWADRPTLNDVFVERGVVPGTDNFQDGFITPDCNKVYFATLDRLWIAPRAP
jgi:hypothetical protein